MRFNKKLAIFIIFVLFIVLTTFFIFNKNDRKKKSTTNGLKQPYFLHSNNNCYMVSLLNLLFHCEKFSQFLDNCAQLNLADDSLIKKFIKIKNDHVKNFKESINFKNLSDEIIDKLNRNSIEKNKTADTIELLEYVLSDFHDEEPQQTSDYFGFVSDTGDSNLGINPGFQPSILIQDNIEDFQRHFKSTPQFIFICSRTNSVDEKYIQEYFEWNSSRYVYKGCVCRVPNHYYTIIRSDGDDYIEWNNGAAKAEKKDKNARILVFERE